MFALGKLVRAFAVLIILAVASGAAILSLGGQGEPTRTVQLQPITVEKTVELIRTITEKLAVTVVTETLTKNGETIVQVKTNTLTVTATVTTTVAKIVYGPSFGYFPIERTVQFNQRGFYVLKDHYTLTRNNGSIAVMLTLYPPETFWLKPQMGENADGRHALDLWIRNPNNRNVTALYSTDMYNIFFNDQRSIEDSIRDPSNKAPDPPFYRKNTVNKGQHTWESVSLEGGFRRAIVYFYSVHVPDLQQNEMMFVEVLISVELIPKP